VVANPVAAGTPKYAPISGQKIWAAQTASWDRARMLGFVKETIVKVLEELDPSPIDFYPIEIQAEFFGRVVSPLSHNDKWDLDNWFIIWQKCFQDCLIGNKDGDGNPTTKVLLPDDSIRYITMPPYVKFTPVVKPEDEKLVFIIKSDTRKEVENLKSL